MNAVLSLACVVGVGASLGAGLGGSRLLDSLGAATLFVGKLDARTMAVLLAGRCNRLFAVVGACFLILIHCRTSCLVQGPSET
jgi:hypothetical protein